MKIRSICAQHAKNVFKVGGDRCQMCMSVLGKDLKKIKSMVFFMEGYPPPPCPPPIEDN